MNTDSHTQHFQTGFNRRREDQKLPLVDSGFLRINQIVGPNGLVPVGKSTLWAWIKQGKFPSPVKLGPRTTAWQVADVRVWLVQRQSKAEAIR
jgi:prophage regulatory protein